MPPPTHSVLVIGAGVAGAALFYHLTRLGVASVVLFDPATPAAGATGRAAGIVTDQLWNEWDVTVARESREEYERLLRGQDPWAFRTNGFVRWTARPDAAAAMETAQERLRGWGVHVDRVGPDELHALYPWGRFDDVQGALRGRSDAVVQPNVLAETYVREGVRAGGQVEFGTPATSLSWDASGVEMKVGGERFTAPKLVVAAGAWTKGILKGLGRSLPLVPYRTQAATLRPQGELPEIFPSGHDIDDDVYFRPEGFGRVLAGDGTESTEADPDRYVHDGDERFLAHVAGSFAHRLPGWDSAEVTRAWAGVCTATPDRRPLVGPLDDAPDLFVLTGFNGFGVMRAGGVARRLADRIVDGAGGRVEEALAVVSPSRFGREISPFLPRPGFTMEPGNEPRF